jgi:hypothetical protein
MRIGDKSFQIVLKQSRAILPRFFWRSFLMDGETAFARAVDELLEELSQN